VSKKEGKTDFSRRLEQFDGLTSLTMTPTLIFRQIYATGGGGDDFIRDVHVLRVRLSSRSVISICSCGWKIQDWFDSLMPAYPASPQ